MLLRSLENKVVVLWCRANTTPVQLGNLTYDRTNDFSKGNPGTSDLDGALWFAVVCWGSGVRALCSLCYIFQSVFVESQDKNEKTNQFCDRGYIKDAMATTYGWVALCSVWNPWCSQFDG